MWLAPWARKLVGVHDQLWQKVSRKETDLTVEIKNRIAVAHTFQVDKPVSETPR
jgi:hypothetical protein